jgi:cysteinyl-tRNA synthetase
MANVWMHNGFLTAPEGEKMSKSLGNFTTIHALRERWPGEALRLALLSTHYRQPLPWSDKVIADARRTLDHWYELTADVADGAPLCADVLEALQDDLNTPKAFAAMHELRTEAAKGTKPAAASLKASAQLIGLLQLSPAQWLGFRPASAAVDENKVVSLIEARNSARKAKNFKEADRIRDELKAMGIELEDTKDGKTQWKVAR